MNQEKITDYTNSLKQAYLKYFNEEYVNSNLVIPEVYFNSIEKLKIGEFFGLSSSLSNTQWGIDLYGSEFMQRAAVNKATKNDKMFMAIGEWGSNHLFLMCCDKSSDDFGKIFDYNDAYPWCENDDSEVEWVNFEAFIKDEYNVDL